MSTGHRINRRSWTPMTMPNTPPCKTSQSQENITFTNTRDEDLGLLYTAIEHAEDDVDLVKANDKLAGMDGEDEDDASNEGYNLEQSNNEDSEDK